MGNSLLAVRDINHKYIVVERKYKNEELRQVQRGIFPTGDPA